MKMVAFLIVAVLVGCAEEPTAPCTLENVPVIIDNWLVVEALRQEFDPSLRWTADERLATYLDSLEAATCGT